MESLGDVLTQGTGILWCTCQLVVFMLLLHYGHSPRMLLYETDLHNITGHEDSYTLKNNILYPIPNGPQGIHFYDIDARTPFAITSFLTVLFAMATTAILNEREDHIANQDYSPEVQHLALPWDTLFWILFAVLHYNLYALVGSPVHVHTTPLITLLSFVGVYMCSLPRDPQMKYTFQNGLFFMLYLCASILLLSSTHNIQHDYVGFCLMTYIGLDMLLVFGHTWDSQVPMYTIINCRLVYVSISVALNMYMFYVWPVKRANH